MSPKNAGHQAGRHLTLLVEAVKCKTCGMPGDPGLWCDVCARLTHAGCARELGQHIVCNSCCEDWQLQQGAGLDEEQRSQLTEAAQKRQETAEGLAKNLSSIVAHGAQLLGTGVGGAVAAATGGTVALTAGLAKGVVAGAVAAWPRTAGKEPLQSQEELEEKNRHDREEAWQQQAQMRQTVIGAPPSFAAQRPRALGEPPPQNTQEENWEEANEGMSWCAWTSEDVVQYVNDRFGEILPRIDELERKLAKKTHTIRHDTGEAGRR